MASPQMGAGARALGQAVTIAFLDVCYRSQGARAACVLADGWGAAAPSATYVQDIGDVEPYESGQFYRRELPCLLAVLRRLPVLPGIAVVDGYVWLPPGDRPGLGAHLYDALDRRTPVIGVAKTAFAGVEACANILAVLRGRSQRPLFVTAAGMEPEAAAQCVLGMAGQHRIPEMAQLANRLASESAHT